MEIETQLEIGARLQYLDAMAGASVLRETCELGKMIHGLAHNLKARRDS